MPFQRYVRTRRAYAPRMRNGTSGRRPFYRKRHYGVHGLPTRRVFLSRSLLTIRRPFSDCVFLGDGSSNVAAAFYTNPTNQIVFLTGTSGDIPVAVPQLANQAGFSCQWTLTDVLDITPFQDLFNQFQFSKFTVTFTMMNAAPFNASFANTLPTLAVCYDPNDSGLPADYNTITTFENHRVHQFSNATPSFTYTFIPKAAGAFYQTALTTGYASSNSNREHWFDTNSGANVRFYGMKGWFRNFNSGVTSGLGIRMQVFAHIVGRTIQ